MSVRLYTSPVALALAMPKSTSVKPSMENGISLPWKFSLPSPQLTPIPAAIDRLSIDTRPRRFWTLRRTNVQCKGGNQCRHHHHLFECFHAFSPPFFNAYF